MKKAIVITTLLGLGFMLIAATLFITLPLMLGQNAFYSVLSLDWTRIPEIIKGLFVFTDISVPHILVLASIAVGLLLFVVTIIVMIIKKKPSSLFPSLFLLVDIVLYTAGILLIIHPNVTGIWVDPASKLVDTSKWGWLGMVKTLGETEKGMTLVVIGCFAIFVLFILGYVVGCFGAGLDMIFGKKALHKKESKKSKLALPNEKDDVIVVHDDEIVPPTAEEDIDAALGKTPENNAPLPQAAAAPTPMPAATPATPGSPVYIPSQGSIQGPLLVQYINTYSPTSSETVSPAKKGGQVPLSEIQGAITGDKPLTAEDIRKIVREEMAPKEEDKQPVIISVPSSTKNDDEALKAEDVRRIFSEELQKTLGKEKDEGDVIVEEEPAAPALTAEDIRAIIAAEIAASKKEEPAPAKKEEPAPALTAQEVRAAIADEIRAFHEAKKQKEESAPAKKEEPATPSVTASEIRQIINEEFARREPKTHQNDLTPSLIRDIIRQEMTAVPPLQETKVAPVTVVVKAVEEPAPAPAPAPVPAPAPAPVPAPAPAPAPVVVEKPADPQPEEAPKPRVVGAINPDLPPHEKIIRIPFQTRMKTADPDMVKNYNELKSEILSYGVKSRISNKGDTFRLHKITFVKITIAGKSLKLYFALDPKDYANSSIPVQDASHNVYKDIPLVFKVKSELSLRRAKELIADVMEKNGLEQGKVVLRDWAKEIPDAKDGADSDEE